MKKVWKETLLAGTMIDAKSKRPFTISEKDVRDAKRNINRMVAKGRKIPLVWEHLDVEESDPEEWKANYARNTFGWVGGARLSTGEDVKSGLALRPGTLLVRHDIHDARDVDQLRKTGYVSPKIYRGYLDSQNEEYEGVTVAHVAASPTVCQFWQRPFELSDSDAMYLSYTPPDEAETRAECPSYTETFTEFLDRLEMSAFAEPEEDAPVAEEEVVKKKSDGDGDEGGGNADLKAIVKALRDKFGANISDKVSNWNELLIAIESNAGSGMDEEEVATETPDEDLAASADEATAGAGGAPMVMSTLDKDPKKRARAEKEAKPERDEAAVRVNKLFDTGRIDGPKKRALTRVVGTIEMSFGADGAAGGKRWTATMSEIAELEKKPANSVGPPPTGRKAADGSVEMSTTEVGRPADLSGTNQPTAERAQVGADFLLGKIDYKRT